MTKYSIKNIGFPILAPYKMQKYPDLAIIHMMTMTMMDKME